MDFYDKFSQLTISELEKILIDQWIWYNRKVPISEYHMDLLPSLE